MANALAHRDYASPGKVQVRIFDDRIEFWNPGRLPEGWTAETLMKKHESQPPNPLIAKQFFWIKYVEDVGSGTNKIVKWCHEWELPEPVFEYTGTSIVVTIKKSPLQMEKESQKVRKKTIEETSKKTIEKTVEKIIRLIKKNPMITIQELSKETKLSNQGVIWNLNKLKKKNIIKRIGPDKGGHWEIL